jgi:Fic family protein
MLNMMLKTKVKRFNVEQIQQICHVGVQTAESDVKSLRLKGFLSIYELEKLPQNDYLSNVI